MLTSIKKYYLDPFLTLPKLAWILSFGALVNSIGRVAIPFFTIFATEKYNISLGTAGILLGIYGAGNVLGSYFGGIFSDRTSGQTTLKLSLLFAGLGFIGISISNNIFVLGFVFLWISFFESWYRPAFNVCVADLFDEKERIQVISLYRTMINLGFSIGAASSMWIAQLGGWDALCIVDGITSILSVIVFHFMIPASNKKMTNKKKTVSFEPFKNSEFNYIFAAMLLIAFVFFQLKSTVPAYFSQYGLSKEWFATLLTLNGITVVLIELPLNTYLKSFKKNKVAILGAMLLGIGLVACTVATNYYLSILSLVVWTVGEIMIFPVVISMVMNLSKEGNLGAYMGSYQLIFSISSITAPIIGLSVFTNLSPDILWILCAILSVLSGVLLWKSESPLSLKYN